MSLDLQNQKRIEIKYIIFTMTLSFETLTICEDLKPLEENYWIGNFIPYQKDCFYTKMSLFNRKQICFVNSICNVPMKPLQTHVIYLVAEWISNCFIPLLLWNCFLSFGVS